MHIAAACAADILLLLWCVDTLLLPLLFWCVGDT